MQIINSWLPNGSGKVGWLSEKVKNAEKYKSVVKII